MAGPVKPLVCTRDQAETIAALLKRKVRGGAGIEVRETRDAVTIALRDPERRPKPAQAFLAFMVRVKQVGGSAGSAATRCTFTYDAWTADDDTTQSATRILIGVSLGNDARPPIGKMVWQPEPGQTWGYALCCGTADPANPFKLYHVRGEVLDPGACT